MVPIVVDSIVLAPAAAIKTLTLTRAAAGSLLMKTFPKKDLPQGKVLSWWEFKTLYTGGDKGVLFFILLSCHCRTLESGEGPVNDTIKGKNMKQEAEAKGEGLDWSHPWTD